MARTTDFGIKYGAKFQTQINTVPADLYGGANGVTLGAGDQVLLDDLMITDTPEQFKDIAVNGTQFAQDQIVSAILVPVQGSTKVYTYGIENLLVSAFGYQRLDGPVANSGVYGHLLCVPPNGKDQRAYNATEAALTLTPAYDVDDRINAYMTFVKHMGPSDQIAKNTSIKTFSIKGESRGPLMLEFTGTAETSTRDATRAQGLALTVAANTQNQWYMLRNCRNASTGASGVKMGPAGALVEVSALSFAINVTAGQADGQIPTGTANGGLSQAEPVATGETEIIVEVKRYLHDTDTYKDYEQVGTEIACSIEAVYGTRKLALCIPRMKITAAVEDKADGGSITITGTALVPTAASEAFTAIRTINATEMALPFTTAFYAVLVSPESVNQMRSV
jgi:hypothetical protein